MTRVHGEIGPLNLMVGVDQLRSDAAWFTARSDEGGLQEVRLRIDLDWDDWQVADRSGAFHLADQRRGPTFGGELRAGEDVRVEALLDQDGVTLVELLLEDPREFGARLVGKQLAALRDASRWWATDVTQAEAPGVRTGFRLAPRDPPPS